MKLIRLLGSMLDKDVKKLEGKFIERGFDYLVTGEDTTVLKPDGSPLLVYRHAAMPEDISTRALPALRRAARVTYNRATVAGLQPEKRGPDGKFKKTRPAIAAESGIVGYFGRSRREPTCRATAFTRSDLAGYSRIIAYAQAANLIFKSELPERYAAQAEVVARTAKDFVIPNTVFTTVTVNRNLRTRVHTDKNDLAAGFGVMSVLRSGNYSGGLLVFPQYRVAVDLRDRDVLLADVHEYHGNTPIIGEPGWERISTVMYFRERLQTCGNLGSEELMRLRRRNG